MDAPAPADSNTLVIPLPPGMTGAQYLALQGSLANIGICVAAAFAIIVWDYLVTFKDEWLLYTKSSRAIWQQPGTWAFILLRYSAIFGTFTSLFFTSIQSTHCDLAVRIGSFAIAVSVASAGCIFSYRVFALWKGNKLVYGIIGLAYAIMLACWFSTASTYRADTGPPTAFNSNCQLHPTAVWNPISFGSSVLFDCVVLVLTMLKLRHTYGTRSAVNKQLYQDNLMYFVITTATNLTVLIINTLGPQYALIKPAAEPFATVVTVGMATRVYLNLKLLYQRQAAAASQGDVALSGMSSESSRARSRAAHGSAFVQVKQDSFVGSFAAPGPEGPVLEYDPESLKNVFYTRETTVA